MKSLRVLISDDHELVRRGARRVLHSQSRVRVVGGAVNEELGAIHLRDLSQGIHPIVQDEPGKEGQKIRGHVRNRSKG